MSNFHSNYNDIHKQIAIADFTDEQIQELMTALQIKRSAKSKLKKEEKVFYQCCRERRSYAQNQDLDTVVCPICGSVKVIKNGTRNGRQRYFCKDCKKTFGDTNGTVAFRSKMSIGKWIEFIKLTLQGESCRTIAKNLCINKQTVLPYYTTDIGYVLFSISLSAIRTISEVWQRVTSITIHCLSRI